VTVIGKELEQIDTRTDPETGRQKKSYLHTPNIYQDQQKSQHAQNQVMMGPKQTAVNNETQQWV
jgi:hypothetical protein